MIIHRHLIIYSYFFLYFFSCSNGLNRGFQYDCYDFQYSDLYVDFDLLSQEIIGSNLMYFEANCPIETISIDLFSNLYVDSVFLNHNKVDFARNEHKILIERG